MKRHAQAGRGVGKFEVLRMQQHARVALRNLGAGIEAVTHNGVPNVCQVNPQLVAAAGDRAELYARLRGQGLPAEYLKTCQGRLASGVDLLPRALGPIGHQGRIDIAALLGHQAIHDSDIALMHFAQRELVAQSLLRRKASGKQQQARGGHVQVVNHFGIEVLSLDLLCGAAHGQTVAAWHAVQSAGLVEDDQEVVNMDDLKRLSARHEKIVIQRVGRCCRVSRRWILGRIASILWSH